MAQSSASRWQRLALGAAILAAGAAFLVARPGIALAHHVTVTEDAGCSAWSTKAEYIGGPEDRKVVVDVTVNAEHISETFFFDNDAGHLGHQDSYVLYQRTGAGTLHTSGTITMYARLNGAYAIIVTSASPNTALDCASTATPARTATAERTVTRVAPTTTRTSTAVAPSTTPASTATVQAEGTATPLATNTPQATTTVTTGETVTPLSTATPIAIATSTATAVAPSSTSTPRATATAVATGDRITPPATPTLVSLVLGSRAPDRPGEDQSPASPSERALPSTGQGSQARGALVAGLLGTLLAAIGLGVYAIGLRTRGMG